jgi:hypothetical protein
MHEESARPDDRSINKHLQRSWLLPAISELSLFFFSGHQLKGETYGQKTLLFDLHV